MALPQKVEQSDTGGSDAEVVVILLVVKNPPANAGGARELGSAPGSGRSPGGGQGQPTPVSALENPLDRGSQRAAVHGVAKRRTQLSG